MTDKFGAKSKDRRLHLYFERIWLQPCSSHNHGLVPADHILPGEHNNNTNDEVPFLTYVPGFEYLHTVEFVLVGIVYIFYDSNILLV